MKTIGLVGGISWISTLPYYQSINAEVNRRLGGLEAAELVLVSLNFGELQRLGWPNARPLLQSACDRLKAAGAELIVLCANTAHLYAEAIEADTGLPLVHIGRAVAAAVQASGHRRIGLLGTIFTMELPFYRDALAARGIETLVPEPREVREYIQRTVRDELGVGIVRDDTRQHYQQIVAGLVARGAEAIVLGCTEIPLLLRPGDVAVPLLDSLQIHVQAIVDTALRHDRP
jgi:aspartate racemase